MGVPKQEMFLKYSLKELNINLAIPIGGSLEVIAGNKLRAPVLLQNIGLEWLFRLLQEPRRLFKRYFVTNCQFLGLLIRELLTGELVKVIESNDSKSQTIILGIIQ